MQILFNLLIALALLFVVGVLGLGLCTNLKCGP